MKEWLRILPIAFIFFAVLTYLDFYADPSNIHWLWNFTQSAVLTGIGCVGQYLIHKNILNEEDDEDENGCINCGKP